MGELVPAFLKSVVQTHRDQAISAETGQVAPKTLISKEMFMVPVRKRSKSKVISTEAQVCPTLRNPLEQVPVLGSQGFPAI